MGSFQGHAIPGSFFLVFGLYWTVQVTRRYMICQYKKIPFYSSGQYPCGRGRCLFWPVEAILIVVMTTCGMIGETIASTDFGRANRIMFYGDIQHVSMYAFFCMMGVFSMLVHWRKVPPDTDYVMGFLALCGEFLLFKHHSFGGHMGKMETLCHTLLLYVIAAGAVSVLVELKYRTNVLAAYTRVYCITLQGTWFIQAAFILFPPFFFLKPWEDKEEPLKRAVCTFAWHCILVVVGMGLLILLSRHLFNRMCPPRKGNIEYELVTGLTSNMTSEERSRSNYRELNGVGDRQKLLENNTDTDQEV